MYHKGEIFEDIPSFKIKKKKEKKRCTILISALQMLMLWFWQPEEKNKIIAKEGKPGQFIVQNNNICVKEKVLHNLSRWSALHTPFHLHT